MRTFHFTFAESVILGITSIPSLLSRLPFFFSAIIALRKHDRGRPVAKVVV